MNKTVSKTDSWQATRLLNDFAITLLLLHYYAQCYPAFQPQGILGKITDALYKVCQNIPMLSNSTEIKTIILLIFIPSIFLSTAPSRKKIGYAGPIIVTLVGLYFYYSTIMLTPIGYFRLLAYNYAGITTAGFALILVGSSLLARSMKYVFHAGRFQSDSSGFKQEERLITTPHSINFPARYSYNGKLRNSYINIINPRRGVLIMGFPGSGKSWFIIEPAIEQLTQKGKALFVYDFKYPALTRFTYNRFLHHQKNYPQTARFHCINFTDLSRTYRCNLIDPKTLEYSGDAMAISRTILLSMNKLWVSKQGDFFVESAITYLASLIWFLKVYKKGIYCTLPHVIELSKIPYEELFTILNAEPATRGMIGPFRDAYRNNTKEMLDGQTVSARVPLTRLDSADIYYVLSGNDMSLEINDPDAPAVLCLGGDSKRYEAFAPIMSLYIDRINRLINHPGGYPVALVIDEFATVRAINILDTVATGRGNDITTILAIQDMSQLRQRYSHDEADQIMNTTGNLICGQLSGETARLISERFQGTFGLRTTISVNSSDVSTSKTEQTVDAVTPSTLANLSSGEFVGITADDPGKKIKLKAFHAFIKKRPNPKEEDVDLPIVREIDPAVIVGNYELIGLQITDMIKEEMKRILGDPQLRQYIVKK